MRSYIFFLSVVQIMHAFSQDSTADVKKEAESNGLKPTCQRKIYCESEFMHDVQMASVYPDSKSFVDKKLKFAESDILSKYKKLKEDNENQVPSKSELIKFIDENLEDGDELEVWTPSDFSEKPAIVDRIKDPDYKQWAFELNHVWKTLARKIKDDVRTQPDKYSLIWVPNGFVIPGGRFRELYYWDTYWIVNGLLLCDMISTARGVIDNILSLVKQFGFVPNGSRVYYLNRSQPPMLILMESTYYKATNDFSRIEKNIDVLERELQFWLKNRMVTFTKNGKTYSMARYHAPSKGPRPESYREDYQTAEKYRTEKEKNDVYTKLKSAAESGWDFSSRWFISADNSNRGELSHIQTSNIIPVDLNSILQVNALTLSTWYKRIGNKTKADKYNKIAQEFLKNIKEVMWREDKGAWFDWNIISSKHREYFYVSNIVPLWTGSYDMPSKSVARGVIEYLKDQHIIEADYSVRFHGIPTSTIVTSQQWDFPNAWPPLQAFIIQGLDRTGDTFAQEVAARMAEVWLRTNYKGFTEKTVMFEKYDVLTAGETGGGGEYTPQTGFGWTNGVVFEFLNRWGYVATYNLNERQNNNSKYSITNIRDILLNWIQKILQYLTFRN